MSQENQELRSGEGEGNYEAARSYNEHATAFAHASAGHDDAEESVSMNESAEPAGEGSYEGAEQYNEGASEFADANDYEMAEGTGVNQESVVAEREAKNEGLDEHVLRNNEDPLHVEYHRDGWVLRTEDGAYQTHAFEHIEDALRRAHQIARETHVALHVHGPDGGLVDRFESV